MASLLKYASVNVSCAQGNFVVAFWHCMRMPYGLTLSTSLTFPPPAYFPVFPYDCPVTLFTWMAIMIIIWLPSLATSAVVRLTQAKGHWREREQSVLSRNSRGLSSMGLLSVSSVQKEFSALSPALYRYKFLDAAQLSVFLYMSDDRVFKTGITTN